MFCPPSMTARLYFRARSIASLRERSNVVPVAWPVGTLPRKGLGACDRPSCGDTRSKVGKVRESIKYRALWLSIIATPTVAAVYLLRLRAIALALRGPPAISKPQAVGGHRSCERIGSGSLSLWERAALGSGRRPLRIKAPGEGRKSSQIL